MSPNWEKAPITTLQSTDSLKRLNMKGKHQHPRAKVVRCFALDNKMCIPNILMPFRRHSDCYMGGKQHGYTDWTRLGVAACACRVIENTRNDLKEPEALFLRIRWLFVWINEVACIIRQLLRWSRYNSAKRLAVPWTSPSPTDNSR